MRIQIFLGSCLTHLHPLLTNIIGMTLVLISCKLKWARRIGVMEWGRKWEEDRTETLMGVGRKYLK